MRTSSRHLTLQADKIAVKRSFCHRRENPARRSQRLQWSIDSWISGFCWMVLASKV
jgi:hypothetical protein